MRSYFIPIDYNSFRNDTYFMRKHGDEMVEKSAHYSSDTEKESRIKQGLCKTCYYFMRGGMAGQAFTRWNCGVCGLDQVHANTATPRACKTCSDQYEVCCKCGGDREQKERRKLKFTPITKEQAKTIRETP